MNDAAEHDQGAIWQNELLTVQEVAAYLRVSRVTVWRWCQLGTIPAARVGRNWRIHRDDLLTLLETSDPTPDPAILLGPLPSKSSQGASSLTTSATFEPDEANSPDEDFARDESIQNGQQD